MSEDTCTSVLLELNSHLLTWLGKALGRMESFSLRAPRARTARVPALQNNSPTRTHRIINSEKVTVTRLEKRL